MPPSASQRPNCDSTSLSINFRPAERPRSITSHACGLASESNGDETLNDGADWLVASSEGWGLLDTALRPLFSGAPPRADRSERALGFSGAPHSSQYCEPSRFSVLHLSHVIISSGGWRSIASAICELLGLAH